MDKNKMTRKLRSPSYAKYRELAKAGSFINAIQYVGGIMSVVLVEEYGWKVEEVEELVKKMQQRLDAETNKQRPT